ncbi:MAG: hypothetical protein L3J71_16530 [Victivallaceae bacterium]|nr:hypothetical protein [Victivallaceae bacterium]
MIENTVARNCQFEELISLRDSKESAWKRKTLDGTLKYFFERNFPLLPLAQQFN